MRAILAMLLIANYALVPALAEETDSHHPAGPPGDAEVVLENGSVQVLRIRIAPHEKTPMHDVTQRVVVWLADARFVDSFPDGMWVRRRWILLLWCSSRPALRPVPPDRARNCSLTMDSGTRTACAPVIILDSWVHVLRASLVLAALMVAAELLGRTLATPRWGTRSPNDGAPGFVTAKLDEAHISLFTPIKQRPHPRNAPTTLNAALAFVNHWRGDRESVEDRHNRR
jgi:hypothetical protein